MSRSSNNSQETERTYINGCNGDCYQGRWCDCTDAPEDEVYDKQETITTVVISALVSLFFTLLVVFISTSNVPGV